MAICRNCGKLYDAANITGPHCVPEQWTQVKASYNPGGDDDSCPECGEDGDDSRPKALCCPECEQEYGTDDRGWYIRECVCRDHCISCGERFPTDELGDPIRPKHCLCQDCFEAERAEWKSDHRDDRDWEAIDRENLA